MAGHWLDKLREVSRVVGKEDIETITYADDNGTEIVVERRPDLGTRQRWRQLDQRRIRNLKEIRNLIVHRIAAQKSVPFVESPTRSIRFRQEKVVEAGYLARQWSDLARSVGLDEDAEHFAPAHPDGFGMTEASREASVDVPNLDGAADDDVTQWFEVDKLTNRHIHEVMDPHGRAESIRLAEENLTREDVSDSEEQFLIGTWKQILKSHPELVPDVSPEPHPRVSQLTTTVESFGRHFPARISNEELGDLLEQINTGALESHLQVWLALAAVTCNLLLYRVKEAFRRRFV